MNKKQFLLVVLLSTAFVSFAGVGKQNPIELNLQKIEELMEKNKEYNKDCTNPFLAAEADAKFIMSRNGGIDATRKYLNNKFGGKGIDAETILSIVHEANRQVSLGDLEQGLDVYRRIQTPSPIVKKIVSEGYKRLLSEYDISNALKSAGFVS